MRAFHNSGNVNYPLFENNFIVDNRGSEWDEYMQSELSSLCKLPKNWDGYQSPAVSFENANQAMRLLSGLKNRLAHSRFAMMNLIPTPPYLIPVSGGALQAEWHLNDGNFIELFFDYPASVKVFAYSENEEWESESDIDLEDDQINTAGIINLFRLIKNRQETANAKSAASA